MVLLAMTPRMVGELSTLSDLDRSDDVVPIREKSDDLVGDDAQGDGEPSLDEPVTGNPISHEQVVDLWKRLRASHPSCSLEQLLQGSRVYVPPPPPKPEPSDEYKALMARLRREEAARAYQRMVDPPSRSEAFSHQFPNAAHAFAEVNRPTNPADLGDDDITLGEVHRQVMLILNFLVSILGVAATLWVVARWWSLPARIFLSMGGAIVVAIAEVGVYQVYIWRMGEAKSKQKTVREVKEVVNTWVVGNDENQDDDTILLKNSLDDHDQVRRRRPIAAAEVKPDN